MGIIAVATNRGSFRDRLTNRKSAHGYRSCRSICYMQTASLKTQEQQADFIRRFAEIIKNNDILKDNYTISFRHFANTTHVFIMDKRGHSLNLSNLLSNKEFSEYVSLLNWWKR